MTNTLTRVGLCCVTSGLGISRARPNADKLRKGSLANESPEAPPEATGWVFLPYTLGLLQSFVQGHATNAEQYQFDFAVHNRVSVEEAVQSLVGKDVVGFSMYVWNERVSLSIAKQLKAIQPETLTVFGGPQVPDHAEDFLRRNPFVDVALHGEGEIAFMQLLETHQTREWSNTDSISYLDGGAFVSNPKRERLRDLDSIPPVYSAELFRPLIDDNPGTVWGALLETNRGCPFACTFCDWGSATNSKVFQFSLERLEAELDWIGKNKIEYVFCCDANFGMLPRDVEIARMVARVKEKYGFPKTFATQNTKNSTDRSYAVQKILHESGATSGVTLSFQSLDEQTLQSVKRDNISIDSFSELQQRYTRDKIPTYTDIILALPGETYASFVNGLSQIIAGGQHNNLFFYNCSILPNAEMAAQDYIDRFDLQTVRQEMLEVHSDLNDVKSQEVREYIPIVVATSTMSPGEWIDGKTVWWMADLVYFGRMLQIPFVLLSELYGFKYGDLIAALAKADQTRFPLIGSIVQMFREKARQIQDGGLEYCPSSDWLNAYWPANQFALAMIVSEGKTRQFYQEARQVIFDYLHTTQQEFSANLVSEAIEFNHKLLRVPFVKKNLKVDLNHNIWEFYQGILEGTPVELKYGSHSYGVWRTQPLFLELDDWLEHVVFCQNVKYSYLYPVVPLAQNPPIPDANLNRARAILDSSAK